MSAYLPYLIGAVVMVLVQKWFPNLANLFNRIVPSPSPNPAPAPNGNPLLDEFLKRIMNGQLTVQPQSPPPGVPAADAHVIDLPMQLEVRKTLKSPNT